MTRTIVNIELLHVAKFLARLLKRSAPRQKKIVRALEKLRTEADLEAFDAWTESENEIVALAARAVRRHCTKTKVLQACVLAARLAAQKAGSRGKMSELLYQRRDFIDCFIW